MKYIDYILFAIWIFLMPFLAGIFFEINYASGLIFWIPFCLLGLVMAEFSNG